MSKYIYILIFFLGFIVGCGKNSDPIGPVAPSGNDEPNWIVLPSGSSSSLQKNVSTGQFVWGNKGAILNIYTHYAASTPFHFIAIRAKAEFQKDSFEGCTFVTMSINDRCGVTTFSPDLSFSKPVIYNLTIIGLDLSGINPANVNFVYLAPDGQYVKADYDDLIVDRRLGKLQVINARIPHFSRYGFAN